MQQYLHGTCLNRHAHTHAPTCIFSAHCRSTGERKVHGERGPSLQPRFHPDLLDPAPRVGEPSRELREVHPAVVGEVLLLGLRRVGVGLVFLDPLHEYCSVPHSPYGVRERCLAVSGGFVVLLMRGALLEATVAHNTGTNSSLYASLQLRCTSFNSHQISVFIRQDGE